MGNLINGFGNCDPLPRASFYERSGEPCFLESGFDDYILETPSSPSLILEGELLRPSWAGTLSNRAQGQSVVRALAHAKVRDGCLIPPDPRRLLVRAPAPNFWRVRRRMPVIRLDLDSLAVASRPINWMTKAGSGSERSAMQWTSILRPIRPTLPF
jgi:hypothetical protein